MSLKTTLLGAGFLSAVLFLGFSHPAAAQETTEELLQKLVAPLKMLHLSLQEPDTELFMPVQGVLKRDVPDTWHAPRGNRKHEGQDILAKKGTPIYSATRGVILQMGLDGMGGNSVFVFGAGGRAYYYAHLDRFASGLKPGDEVATSSLIGFVGDTGNAKGGQPHLHFGIYTGNSVLNPLPLLTDR